jgi:hypothetical protein
MLPREDVKKDHENSDGEADEAPDNGGAADRLIVVLAQDCVGTSDETADRNRRGHEADRHGGALEQHTADRRRKPVTRGTRNVSSPFPAAHVVAARNAGEAGEDGSSGLPPSWRQPTSVKDLTGDSVGGLRSCFVRASR